jgi:hypothetical protein
MDTNYAFIKNQTVTNVIVFDDPTPELLEQFKNEYDVDEIVLAPHIYVEPLDSYVDGKFIAKQTYNGWVFDEEHYSWQPPIPYPSDGLVYVWDNETLSWV